MEETTQRKELPDNLHCDFGASRNSDHRRIHLLPRAAPVVEWATFDAALRVFLRGPWLDVLRLRLSLSEAPWVFSSQPTAADMSSDSKQVATKLHISARNRKQSKQQNASVYKMRYLLSFKFTDIDLRVVS